MSSPLAVANSAYNLRLSNSEWLEQLGARLAEHLDMGRGMIAYHWQLQANGTIRMPSLQVMQGRDGDDAMLTRLAEDLDASRSTLAYVAPYSFRSLSEIAHDHPQYDTLAEDRDMQRISHERGVYDFEMLRVDRRSGEGWMFAVMRRELARIPALRRKRWQQVAAHLAAAARLRERLGGEVQLEESAAIWDPRKQALEHISGGSPSSRRQETLLELIKAREQALALSEEQPDAALKLWPALANGRWSLLDMVDTDGKSYTVLRENPLPVRSEHRLSERERQVAWLVGRGHHVGLVSYELGLAPSTIRSQLHAAMRKLNIRHQSELCRLVRASETTTSAPTAIDDLKLLTLSEPAPLAPASLSSAEREVARLVYEGYANREIAARRHTSARTVANQLASIYRKMGINSRQELVVAMRENAAEA